MSNIEKWIKRKRDDEEKGGKTRNEEELSAFKRSNIDRYSR